MTDPLEQMRAKIAERKIRKPGKKAWVPVSTEDLAYGAILSFDQTLSKTGFSLVLHTPEEGLRVVEGNVIEHRVKEAVGFEQTYTKAEFMEHDIEQVVAHLMARATEIVHEMPSVTGYRTESSLMAGHFVRRAAKRWGLPITMVSKQAAQAVLVPPDRRSGGKAAVKAAVNVLVPPEQRRAKRWNQDVTDSVANAIYRLHQTKREADAA